MMNFGGPGKSFKSRRSWWPIRISFGLRDHLNWDEVSFYCLTIKFGPDVCPWWSEVDYKIEIWFPQIFVSPGEYLSCQSFPRAEYSDRLKREGRWDSSSHK